MENNPIVKPQRTRREIGLIWILASFVLLSALRGFIPVLAIDFAPMPNSKYHDYEPFIFDLCDEPEVSDAIFPEFAKALSFERLSDAAWILQAGNAIMKEFSNAALYRSIDLFEQIGRAHV